MRAHAGQVGRDVLALAVELVANRAVGGEDVLAVGGIAGCATTGVNWAIKAFFSFISGPSSVSTRWLARWATALSL